MQGDSDMFKPETIAMVDAIIAKLDEKDGMFVQGMVNEIERLQKKVKQQEERISEYSWTINPDRSGGQFSDEEINRSGYQGGW